MRIIFYGTPEFAVASLEKIIAAKFEVVGVVTSPDKPAGRGMHLQQSAVKQCALRHNLEVLQPTNLKSPDFFADLERLKPDLQVIIAFRMLPEKVWNFPPLGSMNLHASLLPDYRGAAPINRAIMNGESKTGVSTFFLQHAIDTGDILMQKQVQITPDDNAGILHDKLMEVGANLLVETLDSIANNKIIPIPQIVLKTHHSAPKIFSNDCEIDWHQAVSKIHNLIRGLSPYPGAFTKYNSKILKIYSGHFEQTKGLIAGVFEIDAKVLRIACQDAWYYPDMVQPEGKRKMPVQDFINGLR